MLYALPEKIYALEVNHMGYDLSSLLEQHGHYELGDGFTLSKTSKLGWCLYFNCKHVDLWIAERDGKPEPADMELTSYRTVVDAFEARQKLVPFEDKRRARIEC